MDTILAFWGRTNKTLIFFRIVLIALITFEALNAVGILHFSPEFTWLWLITTAIFAWFFAEMTMYENPERASFVLVLPLFVLALFLDAFGEIFHLYSAIRGYDKILHFVNSAIVTYGVFVALDDRMARWGLDRALSAVILISMGIALWVFYELHEFLEDMLINGRLMRFGDSIDTGMDLLMNSLGCIVMGIVLSVFMKR